jgi:hypothetical protein
MKKLLISVVAVAFVAMMIANVYANCEPPPCPPPPCETPGFSPGFWKHNFRVYLGLTNGKYSAFEGGELDGVKVTADMLEDFADIVEVTLEEAYAAVSAKGGPPNNMIRADMANAFNDAAGYGPFED